jgi:predicted esterase
MMRSVLTSSLARLLVFVLITVCSLGSHLAHGMAEDLQPGRVIERVVCKDNPNQTYALYLPSNYSPARKWPLLAAFDPGARGNIPVERFKDAAERYGYIVCGSNNSQNGPLAPSAEAAKAMLGDVAARIAIDDRRVYLTGFSGGARAASAIAVWLTGQVAGVIGCGAGLAAGIDPSPSLPFVYYGIVGNEDFNYAEMKRLDRRLQSAGVAHRIEVFEGGHDWAPSDECVRAIEWIELDAMKAGRRSRDDAFIDRLFKTAQDTASANETAGRALEAYTGNAGIAADFKGLRDIAEFEKKAALLKDSKAVKQALNKAQDQENEEIRRGTELFGMRVRLRNPATNAALNGANGSQASGLASDSEMRRITFSDLKGMLSDLKRKSEAKENTPERALARRVLNQYMIAAFEQSMTLIQTKNHDAAVANLTVDSDLMPDNWRILYNLACAYCLKGDKRRAIETLAKAVQKGFANVELLERDRQLDAIREEAGFKKIAEGLKKH